MWIHRFKANQLLEILTRRQRAAKVAQKLQIKAAVLWGILNRKWEGKNHSGLARDAYPAPRKKGPPRPAKRRPCPAPQKLTKPAGCNGAKLPVDYTDYTDTFGLRVGKWRKSFSLGLLYSLWLSGLQKGQKASPCTFWNVTQAKSYKWSNMVAKE